MKHRALIVVAAAFLCGCEAGLTGNFLTAPVATVAPTVLQLRVGDTVTVRASFFGQPASFSWHTSDSTIVTVSRTLYADEGRVRARAPGRAIVTATRDQQTASVTVTVAPVR